MYTLSIALVTRNRPESLEQTLHSLLLQQPKPFEIILSDDSDKEAAIIQNKLLAAKYGCVYITGPHNGLYANRNFVAMHTNGTHFRTMDDDHEFPENHLKICMEAINKEPRTIWTIGEYNFIKDIHEAPHPIPGELHPRGFAYYYHNIESYYGLSCGATIYPAGVIKQKNLNVEMYRFGMVFLEYGARLKSKGYTLKPLCETYIIHHSVETSAMQFQQDGIQEARIFSMLCLSFKYQPSINNKFKTTIQLVADILKRRTSIATVKNAWLNFKNFTSN